MVCLITRQVSGPYRRTAFTFELKILILVFLRMRFKRQMFRFRKATLAFTLRAATSISLPSQNKNKSYNFLSVYSGLILYGKQKQRQCLSSFIIYNFFLQSSRVCSCSFLNTNIFKVLVLRGCLNKKCLLVSSTCHELLLIYLYNFH